MIACLLLAVLGVMTSLGHTAACPQRWVALVRRKLRLHQQQPAQPRSIETGSSYVAPLAANDSAAVQPERSAALPPL